MKRQSFVIIGLFIKTIIIPDPYAFSQTRAAIADPVQRQSSHFKEVDGHNSASNRKLKELEKTYQADFKKWVSDGGKGKPPASYNKLMEVYQSNASERKDLEKKYTDENKRINDENIQAFVAKRKKELESKGIKPGAVPPPTTTQNRPSGSNPMYQGGAVPAPITPAVAPVRQEVVVEGGDTPKEIEFKGPSTPTKNPSGLPKK